MLSIAGPSLGQRLNLLDLYECFAHMHLSAPCAYPVPKEAKGLVLAPLELQLEMVGTHVVAQN